MKFDYQGLKISIQSHLRNSEIDAAENLLSMWPEDCGNDERLAQKQLLGKVSLYRGQYIRALDYFDYCNKANPLNLNTLNDLALCYYQLGLQYDLEKTLLQVSDILNQGIAHIDKIELLDNTVFYSKLMEECGLIAEALNILDLNSINELTFQQRKILLIQKLRLNILIQDRQVVQSLYEEVLSTYETSLNFEIEREHALMLADYYLFGLSIAQERFNKIISYKLSEADQSFIRSEFLELLIISKQLDQLKKYFISLHFESEYEKEFFNLVQNYVEKTKPFWSILKIEKKLTRLSVIRLLRLFSLLFPEEFNKGENTKKMYWHLEKIRNSKVRNYFISHLEIADQKISISVTNKIIKSGSREFTSNQKMIWFTLAIMKNGQASIEDIVSSLYQEKYAEHHFDRLRMAIYRINKDIQSDLNIESFFKVKKNSLHINEKLRIQYEND